MSCNDSIVKVLHIWFVSKNWLNRDYTVHIIILHNNYSIPFIGSIVNIIWPSTENHVFKTAIDCLDDRIMRRLCSDSDSSEDDFISICEIDSAGQQRNQVN